MQDWIFEEKPFKREDHPNAIGFVYCLMFPELENGVYIGRCMFETIDGNKNDWENYCGSGALVKQYKSAFGTDNIARFVIAVGHTIEGLKLMETQEITRFNTDTELTCLNLRCNGNAGGGGTAGMSVQFHEKQFQFEMTDGSHLTFYSNEDICKHFNVSTGTVSNWFKDTGDGKRHRVPDKKHGISYCYVGDREDKPDTNTSNEQDEDDFFVWEDRFNKSKW